MKQNIILIGSGGCMREILWQIEECNPGEEAWRVEGYVDVSPRLTEGGTGIKAGIARCPYLGNDDYLLGLREETNVAICVGEPDLRKKIARILMGNPMLRFPVLILGSAKISGSVSMGKGCIVSMDSRISTDVVLGDFVFLNIGSLVCHDGSIGDFATLSPDVKLAGNVKVGRESSLGLGTRVIQGVSIGSCVTTGAGTVVIRDVEAGRTVAGVPARVLR